MPSSDGGARSGFSRFLCSPRCTLGELGFAAAVERSKFDILKSRLEKFFALCKETAGLNLHTKKLPNA